MKTEDSILIAGGYGVVGAQLAKLIRQQYPELPIIIAGRHPEKATELVQQLGNAQAVHMDLTQLNPLQNRQPRAIISVVNDPHDYLLKNAVANGTALLDITRWTAHMKATANSLANSHLRAPIMLSSAWMAGIAGLMVKAAGRTLRQINTIELNVLYALNDKAGPNSAEYMDRLAEPFDVIQDGTRQSVLPLTDPRSVAFPNGYTTKTYRFDTPDQFTLPSTTGATTVSARIAFDNYTATQFLVWLTRLGIWRLISGPRFTAIRRAIIYNPGTGASHQLVVNVSGLNDQQQRKTLQAKLVDSQGQTHLTAVGAFIQLERLLGLDGQAAPESRVLYPDTAPNIDAAMQRLQDFGIELSIANLN